ncbi:MAG: hypothetical protein HXY18_04235 [Bryobacteraceae bacterium]|nr:hypothetical protein [Bryobacteraceae bacterium]
MATAESGPVLAVASHRREFAGLLRHASWVSPLPWPIQHASNAKISNSEWILAANGEGPRCAAAAMRCALESSTPAAVVSTGFCGALDPALRSGDVFVARKVIDGSGIEYEAMLPRASRECATGALLSLDRIAVTAGEKAALLCRGAAAVEMEAATVAEAARRRAIPFYCIRVVSDGAQSDLPVDFNRHRTAEGRIDTWGVARHAAIRPWLWPRLFRITLDASHASRILGDYLAACRF